MATEKEYFSLEGKFYSEDYDAADGFRDLGNVSEASIALEKTVIELESAMGDGGILETEDQKAKATLSATLNSMQMANLALTQHGTVVEQEAETEVTETIGTIPAGRVRFVSKKNIKNATLAAGGALPAGVIVEGVGGGFINTTNAPIVVGSVKFDCDAADKVGIMSAASPRVRVRFISQKGYGFDGHKWAPNVAAAIPLIKKGEFASYQITGPLLEDSSAPVDPVFGQKGLTYRTKAA